MTEKFSNMKTRGATRKSTPKKTEQPALSTPQRTPKRAKLVKKERATVSARKYVVECIVGQRVNPDTGREEVLVRWEGYPPEQATWEDPTLMDCRELSDLLQQYYNSLAPFPRFNRDVLERILFGTGRRIDLLHLLTVAQVCREWRVVAFKKLKPLGICKLGDLQPETLRQFGREFFHLQTTNHLLAPTKEILLKITRNLSPGPTAIIAKMLATERRYASRGREAKVLHKELFPLMAQRLAKAMDNWSPECTVTVVKAVDENCKDYFLNLGKTTPCMIRHAGLVVSHRHLSVKKAFLHEYCCMLASSTDPSEILGLYPAHVPHLLLSVAGTNTTHLGDLIQALYPKVDPDNPSSDVPTSAYDALIKTLPADLTTSVLEHLLHPRVFATQRDKILQWVEGRRARSTFDDLLDVLKYDSPTSPVYDP